MRRRFMTSVGAAGFLPGIYVSLSGSGNGSGSSPGNSMSYANFLLLTLSASDVVYFKMGDTF